MRITKISAIPWPFELLIVLYVFHTTLPVFGFLIPAIVHGASMFLLYIMLATYDKHFGQNVVKTLPIFSIYILNIIYRGFSNFAVDIYWDLQIFLYPLLALYLMRYANGKTLKRMLIFIGVSYMITAITTYIGNIIFPLASRTIVSTEDVNQVNTYRLYNIGGFNIIYAFVLLLPVVIYMMRDKILPLFWGIIVLIVILATILESEYTTALLVSTLTLVSLFLMRKRLSSKSVLALLAGIIIVVILFDQYIFPQMSRLIGVFEGEQINQKLRELSEFSVGQEAYEGDLGARYNFYKLSIESFANNPIWGSKEAALSGHSLILDTLGQSGLVGLFCLIVMYAQIFRSFYKPFKKTNFYGYAFYSFCIAIALAIINPKDNMLVLTFMIPLCSSYFSKCFVLKKIVTTKSNDNIKKEALLTN